MTNMAEKKRVDEILKLLKNSDEFVFSFRTQIQNKDLIIFIGLTKSGKSTLVNLITGFPLISFKYGSHYKIECTEKSNIGHLSTSLTKIPTVVELNGEANTLIVDAPGFDDNRGSLQEVMNALYINQIKYAKSVKFVLVCDINSILNDNINYFLSFLRTVQTILPHFQKLKHGVSIIFTKDNQNLSGQDIVEMLRYKILGFPDLNCKKDLIEHLVNHVEVIGSFRMPSQAGPLEEDVKVNILEAISNSKAVKIVESEIKFGISDKAQIVLRDAYLQFHDLVNLIDDKVEELVEDTFKKFNGLQSTGLLRLSEDELKKSSKVLEHFKATIESGDYIKPIEELPQVIINLFLDEVNKISGKLRNIKMELVSELNQAFDMKSIEDIRKKIEYLQCLETVLEQYNLSNNILKIWDRHLKKMVVNIKDVLENIVKEFQIRAEIIRDLGLLMDFKFGVLEIGNSYIRASTNNELSRMEEQLQFLTFHLDRVLSEVFKRPSMDNYPAELISGACSFKEVVNNKLLDIQNYKFEMTTHNRRFLKTKIFVGTCVGCLAIFSYQAPQFTIPPMVILLAILDWRTKCFRNGISTIYKRYKQKRLFSARTVLDQISMRY